MHTASVFILLLLFFCSFFFYLRCILVMVIIIFGAVRIDSFMIWTLNPEELPI